MLLPIGTDRPQRRLPLMNLALIAANIAFFFLTRQVVHGHGVYAWFLSGIDARWSPYMLNPPTGLRLDQFISYQFLHADIMHVGFNMLFLYVFGNNLNEKLGNIGYLLFYLTGGVCAGIGQILSSVNPTLGASGSISAVAGLFLVLLPLTHIRLWFFRVWEIPSMNFVLFKVAQNVIEQYIGGGGVAYMAHISGTVAGVAIGMLLLTFKLVRRDYYDLLAMLNTYRRRYEYRAIVARGYDPFDGTKGSAVLAGNPSRRPAPVVDPRITSLRDEIARLLRLHDTRDASQRYLELRAIDAAQVLPPQEQIDVGSQLMADGRHAEAATAYEEYLRVYPSGGASQQDQITLMLGLIYARDARNPARAKELLRRVLPKLHNPGEHEMAAAELKRLDYPPPTGG